jgi:hypothetical protein
MASGLTAAPAATTAMATAASSTKAAAAVPQMHRNQAKVSAFDGDLPFFQLKLFYSHRYHHGTADTANDIAAPPNPTSLIPHGSLEPVGNETRMVKRY